MTQRIEISSKTIIFIIGLLLGLRVLWLTRELIYALFMAFIFMSALKPVVYYLERLKIPHTLSVILVYISSIVSIIFLFAFVLPPLITESIMFLQGFPSLVENTIPNLSFYVNFDSLDKFFPNLSQDFLRFVTSVFSNVVFVISVAFFTFYFLLEEKFAKRFLERFLDKTQSDTVVSVLSSAEERMGAWIRGQLLLMTVISLATFIGLVVLNVPFAFPLAIIAGLLEIVPIIGPTVAAVPAFFVAASNSLFLGASTIGLYVLIQQLENNVLVPVVMKRAVGLNPIITLMALTIGGKLGGFFGILLAVPTALFMETILIEVTKMKK